MAKCGLFVACFVVVAVAVNVNANKHLHAIMTETRLQYLEKMTDVVVDYTRQNSEKITALNDTFLSFAEMCHHGDAEDISTNANLDKSSELTKYPDKFSERMLDAFGQEKIFARTRIDDMADVLEGLKGEMDEVETRRASMATVLDVLVNTVENVESGNSTLGTIVDDFREELEKVQSDNEALTKTLKNVNEELSDVKVHVNDKFNEYTNKVSDMVKLQYDKLEQKIRELATITVKACPTGWTNRYNICYKYYGTRKTYDGAKATCAVHNAHVVDIQNQNEMNFVMTLVGDGNKFWIGLTDTASEGTWVWDRTRVKAGFLNWRPGQPDSWGGRNQDCVFGGNARPYDQWNDYGCDDLATYVCKLLP